MGIVHAEAPPLPVPLAEVKALLRLSVSDEDALLAGLVRAAAGTCEEFTGRALIERSIAETLAAASAWTPLGASPVKAITGVETLDADGDASPLAAEAYAVDIDAAGDGWVRLAAPVEAKRMRVSYRAGMAAEPNGLPETLRHGIVRLAAHLYANRDRAETPGPPAAITALWRPWRRLRLGAG
jgi:uncharacterized phiE125 gp8 family phage protein